VTEESLILKSPYVYQIIIFVIINLWAFMGFEMAQYQLVTLYETPLSWISWVSLVLFSMTPVLGVSVWKLKDRVHIENLEWDFKVREVGLDEFEKMMDNYTSSYRFLLSSFDYPLLLIMGIWYVLTVILPFPMMRSVLLIIQITPVFVALCVVVFGILYSYFTFKFIPNSATPEFPTYNPRLLKDAILFLTDIPGIFWSGVRLTIGESGGYYTIRNPIPVARIEGIEGVARIECALNTRNRISNVTPIFEMEGMKGSDKLESITAPVTPLQSTHLIKSMIEVYLENSGGEELLDDVLEDIDTYLRKHDSTS
jgi:hypothetical protein